MANLGDLERRVMDVLWANDEPMAATGVRETLNATAERDGHRPLAATTVLTVLSRLEDKELVTRDRDTWPHHYRASRPRADHMAELMLEVLGRAQNREAVLARFVGRVSPEEADELRHLLESR